MKVWSALDEIKEILLKIEKVCETEKISERPSVPPESNSVNRLCLKRVEMYLLTLATFAGSQMVYSLVVFLG